MSRRGWGWRGALATVAILLSAATLADSAAQIDTSVAATLERFYAQSAEHRELAAKASAVLVFPRVTKAGAGIAGEHGEGALQVNGKTVAYYEVTGASVGATLGVAHRSEVILFMTDAARERFEKGGEWTVGADTGLAVVKKGAGGEYDTQTLSKPILAFVFGERGLIADASLEGAKVRRLP